MGLLTHILKQDALIVDTVTDGWGDQTAADTTAVKCRFRYISSTDRGSNREQLSGIDAMAWFEPEADVAEGTILQINDKYWRVQRITEARRNSATILFLKASLKVHQLSEGS